MASQILTLHYAPRTRSFTALWLLEELGAPYTLDSFDINTGRHKQPDYLALNPMGKVPVVVDRGRPVAELGAIAIYLSDLYPEAALDSDARPAWLRWIFFASAIIEPALAEKFYHWKVNPSSVAWGSFDHMLATLTAGVQPGPFLLGDQFSAADVLVGSGLRFGMMFGAIPNEEVLKHYLSRCTARPAFERASAIEARESERFPRTA